MVKSLYDVPGFQEKWEAELEELIAGRELAWMELPQDVGRFQIQPLTIRALIDLNAVGNSFIAGGIHTFGDLVALLWRLSIYYQPLPKLSIQGRLRRYMMERKARKLWRKDGMVSEIEDIRDYLKQIRKEENITTKRAGKGKSLGEQVASIAAYRVHGLASQYGWSRDEILDMPLAQVNQLNNVSHLMNDPDARGIAPLAELRNWGLRELNRMMEEERKEKEVTNG